MKTESFRLNALGIDTISEQLHEEMTQLKIAPQEMIRLRFSVEEGLLNWMEQLGEDTPCSIRYGKRNNTFYITLFCKGQRYNPLAQDDDLDAMEDNFNILSHLNLAPTYRYQNGSNNLAFKIAIKKSSFSYGIIFAILGAMISVLVFQYAPSYIGEFVLEYITYPLQTILTNGISMVTGPMLFLAVLTGMMQTGNMQTIKQRGGLMLSTFTIQMFVAAIVTILFCFLGFQYQWAASGDSVAGTSVVLDMIVDIVPTTIFSPFIDGNALQLVFLSVVSGIVLLLTKGKTDGLGDLADQAYQFITVMMGWIAALIPIFVYCTLVNTFVENSDFPISSILFLIIAFFILISAFLLVLFACVVYVCKVTPRLLFQKILPSLMVVLAASSSTATFWHTREVCVKQLGIREDCVNSSLPLGSVLYMPPCVILFTAAALYSASFYGTSVSVQFFLLLIVLCVIMTMAMPPVAGSEIMCLTGLFMGLGIDTAGVSLIVALTVLVNGFLASFGVVSLELTLVLCANKLEELDLDVLRSEATAIEKNIVK